MLLWLIIVVVVEMVDDNSLMFDEATMSERMYVVLDEVNTSSVITVNVKRKKARRANDVQGLSAVIVN